MSRIVSDNPTTFLNNGNIRFSNNGIQMITLRSIHLLLSIDLMKHKFNYNKNDFVRKTKGRCGNDGGMPGDK
jgi:hypothetical protein